MVRQRGLCGLCAALSSSEMDPFIRIKLKPSGSEECTKCVFNGGDQVTFEPKDNAILDFSHRPRADPPFLSVMAVDKNLWPMMFRACCFTGCKDFDIGVGLVRSDDVKKAFENPGQDIHVACTLTDDGMRNSHFRGLVHMYIRFVSRRDSDSENSKLVEMDWWNEPGTIRIQILEAEKLWDTQLDRRFYEDPRVVVPAFAIFGFYLFIGTVFYASTQSWTIVESIYFVAVSITTVGYGDLIFEPTAGTRLFTMMFVLIGLFLLGTVVTVLFGYVMREHAKQLHHINVQDHPMPKRTTRAMCLRVLRRFLRFIIFSGFGIFVLVFVDKFSFLDAFYLSIITFTTVGYGDIHPKSELSRGLLIIWIFFGVYVFASVMRDFLEHSLSFYRKRKLAKTLHRSLIGVEDIQSFDENQDGEISRYEFMVHMLVKMDIVSKGNVYEVNRQFDELDTNNDGVITVDDFKDGVCNHKKIVRYKSAVVGEEEEEKDDIRDESKCVDVKDDKSSESGDEIGGHGGADNSDDYDGAGYDGAGNGGAGGSDASGDDLLAGVEPASDNSDRDSAQEIELAEV